MYFSLSSVTAPMYIVVIVVNSISKNDSWELFSMEEHLGHGNKYFIEQRNFQVNCSKITLLSHTHMHIYTYS